MRTGFIFILSAFISVAAFSQEENWDVYLAQYEKGTGSVMLDLGLKKHAPIQPLHYLIVTGVKFKECNDDGLPTHEGFSLLYPVSDSVKSVIQQTTPNKLVGTFSYQCERLDYYYVADTSGIRSKLISLYAQHFREFQPYISIKQDSVWNAYLNFLYPNEEILEFMSNSKVLMKLVEAGDKLQAPRKIDHWLYFSSTNGRDCFIDFAKTNNYKIESTEKTKDPAFPFKLQVSRTDKIDIAWITMLTVKLKQEATKCNGTYDGWETFVVK